VPTSQLFRVGRRGGSSSLRRKEREGCATGTLTPTMAASTPSRNSRAARPLPVRSLPCCGGLHVQGSDGIEFFTRKKMVVSRW
jgi:hypothetical protein